MTPHQELTATLATTPVLKASFIGVTGPQGPPGPEGPAGPPGPSGSQTPWTTDVDAAGHSLTNAGRVGIGTATPQTPLHSVGDVRFDMGGGCGNLLLAGAGTPDGMFVEFLNAAFNGAASPVYFCGPAFSPIPELIVNGTLACMRTGVSNSPILRVWQPDGSSTGDIAQFQNSTGTVVVIRQSGSVGIGVYPPAHPLDVAGDVNCTGNYLKNGAPVAMVTQEQYDALLARVAALEAKLP